MIAPFVAALHFPPVSHLIEWPDFLFKGTPFALNKIGAITLGAAGMTVLLLGLAGAAKKLVPTGIQNAMEWFVDFFITDQIALQVMGTEGLKWVPLLVSIFMFVFFCNVTEVIPLLQMPASARMAIPAILAGLVWVIFMGMGMIKQGPFKYFKSIAIPPGVPIAILPLVAFIETISTIIVRPFSLAVRLFANMLAGHLLLVTFAVLSAGLFTSDLVAIVLPLPFIFLIILTAFEIFVAGLQAYIFTILTAVYIDSAIHPHH